MCDGETSKSFVKNELWYRIQSKRKAQGLEELKLDKHRVKNEEGKLSPEEIQKIIQRRERNRIAAQKSRDRRKERGDALQKLVEQLTEEQQELEREISSLKTQKEQLKFMADHHNCKREGN